MPNTDPNHATRIVFGCDSVGRLAGLVPPAARVLLLYSREGARRSATLEQVHVALGERVVFEFAGIESHPDAETLMDAVHMVRKERLDFLLAVGGAAALDGTRVVAAAAPCGGDPWPELAAPGAALHQVLPFGVLLTQPATAPGLRQAAVVTQGSTQARLSVAGPRLCPRFSIIDPACALPAQQVARNADALAQAGAEHLARLAQGARVQECVMEGLLQTVLELSPQAPPTAHQHGAAASLAQLAASALEGLIAAGMPQDWSTHRMAQQLTALHHLDHARALTIVVTSEVSGHKASLRSYELVADIHRSDDSNVTDRRQHGQQG